MLALVRSRNEGGMLLRRCLATLLYVNFLYNRAGHLPGLKVCVLVLVFSFSCSRRNCSLCAKRLTPLSLLSLLPTPKQEALGRRSVGGSVAALLKPLFTDLEPASRQLTAIGRATLAQLDTMPGVGEKVRSTLRLLGFVEDEQGGGEEEGEGSGGRK